MLPVAVALAVVVGLALGLLGGGGSILTVPLLVYVAGMDTKQAIATSLFVVGVTSLAGLVPHARTGTIRWRTGLVFGAAGMAGAFVGGLLGGHLPGQLLLGGFALMMLATAAAMLRGRRASTTGTHDAGPRHAELPLARVLVDGGVVGLITGLVGAGGGFLVVPALALLGGLPMPVAVGTSLVVIAMKSFAGFAGYLTSVSIAWLPTLAVTGAAVLGAVVGGRLATRVGPEALQRGFGWFVLVMGAVVLVQQVPGDGRWIAAGALALALSIAGGCALVWSRCPLRAVSRA